ncbi:FIST C-terminal domain-containing protein [Nostocaceae cyanobacterium CENA357]|uniref:FIST C-terminal domain-containing protein n=1 Tax=Atlanticothrix silvestris CENA357 TaxID=1725252 RepID=A0A8J7HG69_9CYAN|nr:FIST N-terminal domain-containing protein [Atlanticothrix silvestris]MBH8555053.1 FIST C-terminal domain-containing protein [Atlanticothrix silvestris CENA357]
MLKVVVGHSEDSESQDAILEVLDQCSQDLAGVIPQAGILFAAIDFNHALILKEIDQVFPGIDLIGCTTDGEISSKLGFQQDSLTLMLFCSDTIEIRAGVGYGAKDNPLAAAHQAVQQATEKSTNAAKLCISIPASYITDGSTTNGELILKGLKLALGSQTPILGGTAGDQFRFKKTYQFFGNEVLTDSLPVLIFSGDIQFSYGIACGWQPIGRKSIVTKAEGTVLYEIDGKSALEFYARYLGDRPPTAENPLAVYEGDSDRYYMRVPNTYDVETGSINFLGDIPEQATVQVTDISRDEVIAAAEVSLKNALENYPATEPEAVLLFSCCCRRWLLGTRAKEEYQLVKNLLSEEVPVCGFYTYGEFAPLEHQGSTYYHQETFVTLLLGTK